MNVYYTSDLHISHRLVSGLRGFSKMGPYVPTDGGETFDVLVNVPNTEAHDAHLAAVWDRTVNEDDQVYVLGDISINGGQHALDWIEARPGSKHLITGNHDPVGPHDRRAPRLMKHWMNYFDSIQSMARRKLDGRNFMLSHYPYWSYGDGPERPTARNEQYRVPELGLPLLHGHTHGQERDHGNMLHVGWDAWGELVPQDTVQEWLYTLD